MPSTARPTATSLIAGSTVYLALVLGACADKKDDSKANFERAIQQHLAAEGDLCLGFEKWPVDIRPDDRLARPMLDALAGIGLLAATDETVESEVQQGPVPARRYTPTPTGEQFLRTIADRRDLCYGRRALTEVVKWEGPIALGKFQQAKVTYTYRLEGLAPWATKPEIQSALPVLARTVGGAGKRTTIPLNLTSTGWEAQKSRLFEAPRDFRSGTPPQRVMTRLP